MDCIGLLQYQTDNDASYVTELGAYSLGAILRNLPTLGQWSACDDEVPLYSNGCQSDDGQ